MLDILRRNSRHWLVIALMALVVVGLTLFFGSSSRNSKGASNTWAAKVGGDTIKMGEFLTRYRNVVENYKRKFGPDFDEKLLEPLNIKFQMLSSMVTDRIIEKESKKDGLGVSSVELSDIIAKIPYFQKDGVFSLDYYKGMLAYNRMSPKEFEEIQEREILREKLGDIIMNSYKASDEEIRDAYIVDNQATSISYIKVETNDEQSKVQKVTDKEIDSFLKTEEGKKQAQDYYIKNNKDFVDAGKNNSVKKFEDVRRDIARNLLAAKKGTSSVNLKIEKALATNNIKKAAAVLKDTLRTTSKFTRKDSSIPGLSSSNTNDVLWAFGIKPKKLYTREIGSSTYIVVNNGVNKTDIAMKGKKFKDFSRNYMSQRASTMFVSYIDELKRKWAKKVQYSPAVMGFTSSENN